MSNFRLARGNGKKPRVWNKIAPTSDSLGGSNIRQYPPTKKIFLLKHASYARWHVMTRYPAFISSEMDVK
jgi:hypothetical protein